MNEMNYKQTDEVLRFEQELGKLNNPISGQVKEIISDIVVRYGSLTFTYSHEARDRWIVRRVAELRTEAEKEGNPRSYEDIYEQVAREVKTNFRQELKPYTIKHIFRESGVYKSGD